MRGRRSRDKGARTERAIERLLQAQGIAATKVSCAWFASANLRVPVLGVDRAAAGFRQLYHWLNDRDVSIVKADRQEPLVIVWLGLATEVVGEK
jgi:hypothetical protein